MGFTAKLDLEEIAYGTAGWNAILTTNLQKIDDSVHTFLSETAGETLTSYAVVYLESDGKYYLAQADGTQQPGVGISLEAAVADNSFRFQRCGPLTNAGWSWTPGAALYLDPSTPGDMTETKPSSNAQIIAYAISATKVFVWPEHVSSITPFPSTGVEIYDTDSSHTLSLVCSSDLTADRDLSFVTGDSDRTITLSGSPTLNDWFDQSVKTTAFPSFTGIELSNTGLHILDTNGSHDLIIVPGSDLTADRSLNLVTGDSDRTITLSGNPSLGDWFDQSVKTSVMPIFLGIQRASADDLLELLGSDESDEGAGIWLYGRDHATLPGKHVLGFGGYDDTGILTISHRNTAGSLVDKITIDSDGNMMLGVSVVGTNADTVLGIGNGTAPTTQPADMFQMYAADQAAGNSCPHIMTESGDVIKLYQEAALTAQETTITHTAPGTPDYAIQDLTQTDPFGFVTKDEGNSVLQGLANLQTRFDELETRLRNQGLLASS